MSGNGSSPDEDVELAAKQLAVKIAHLPREGQLAAAIAHVGDSLEDFEFLIRRYSEDQS